MDFQGFPENAQKLQEDFRDDGMKDCGYKGRLLATLENFFSIGLMTAKSSL
jgi:hypothetical protein